ncbi:tryptophan synthase subunit alpha [Hazenella sp. IB182357]|uniref:Tryptophan synthase alpha chain n=1 Tax=Polycladospora coralii TaxID=2771432 RepID=A0A926RSN9_9BACL|nr:tryptophan synthase subunit alpha [Polycladospora coralii]MBD1371610.1 tryptophan synthase subunit alpha [Polycladospora coralii]
MNRIELRLRSGKQLIPFLMAGDPNLEVTLDLIQMLQEEEVAAIEIGVPFSDPTADGPAIQLAAERSLRKKTYLKDVLLLGKQAQARGLDVPLILFSYSNPLYHYGFQELIHDAHQSGFEGIIVPDLPYEESLALRALAESYGIAVIPLVAPTSGARMEKIVEGASGFIYCVSSVGTTGVRTTFNPEVELFLNEVRRVSPVPIAVGFGISQVEHVRYFHQHADSVIVGSAFVQQIEAVSHLLTQLETRSEGISMLRQFVRTLKSK